jgi:hypothetical protein
MQKLLTLLSLFLLALVVGSPRVAAEVSAGVTIDEDGLKGFYLSVGEHYGVQEKEVVVVRERNVPDDDLPVVFFLARHARVEPAVIVKLRLGGKSWMDIAFHYGLTAEIFYVDFERDPGPPYGKAWGHFKKKKRADWGTIRLVDADVVNLVNLKFVSERYGYSPHEIVKMRAKGQDFVRIHKEVKARKGPKAKKTKALATSEGKKAKGGKGKKK